MQSQSLHIQIAPFHISDSINHNNNACHSMFFFFFLPLFTSISWLFPVLISHNFAQWISLPCQTTLYVCSDPDTKGSSVTLLSLQSTLTLKACHLFLNKRFANHPYLRTTPIPGSKSIYTSFKSDLQSSKSSQNGKKVNNIQNMARNVDNTCHPCLAGSHLVDAW